MHSELTFRSFNDKDYNTVNSWWDYWWTEGDGIERKFLPRNKSCFIIEKGNIPIAAAFLFIDKYSPMAYLTYMVSNPKYREKDRRSIIEQLITNIEKEAKSQGVEFIFTVCGNIHLENIHGKLGWTIDKSAPAYETFKYI
jgi:hypothetical protein|tara:strand:- start:170 stop:589 length:420 start_codon:yes stop_codon:yes gene_type:complete